MDENLANAVISVTPENNENALNEAGKEKVYPVIPLRGKVLFPDTILNFDVGRPMSVAAIDVALANDSLVFISVQKSALIDAPKKSDVCKTGSLCRIKQTVKLPDGNLKVTVESFARAKIKRFEDEKKYFSAVIELAPYDEINPEDEFEAEAIFRLAKTAFARYTEEDKRIPKETAALVGEINQPNAFVDRALAVSPVKEETAQTIFATDGTLERLNAFYKTFVKEREIFKIENKIAGKVKASIDKNQKEFLLKEQLRAIHDELGDGESDSERLEKKLKEKNLPKEVLEHALKELSRLENVNPSSPDYSVILNYIDWVLELPFGVYTEDNADINKAKEILDKDHFGLVKVKERILEYLAVLTLTKEVKGPILCFVGPPGVGKTSIAASVARALNRKFVRMSLGGVGDEAEIRGHRKTYVGAMPGRIIYGLKNAGSANPVFLLDEADKMSSDVRGDPASALLEVLDPEQNATFVDRYLEVPFDLSKVLFITTANSVETIPYPLLDRMEIIELGSYTEREKKEIAKRYLIPKETVRCGLDKEEVVFTDEAVAKVIKNYTREAGVRNLEREIGAIIRKITLKVAESGERSKKIVTAEKVEKYLGAPKFSTAHGEKDNLIGAATGLAWTSVGGTVLTIEVALMHGKGEILLTGKLGDVMKESARAALSYIREHADKYGIDEKRFAKTDVHVHVPEGATPKDGPSAGITMATALLSAFTGKPVKGNVAMTGEITLRGNVLAIGGLKEKALAAYSEGIDTVIIPQSNVKDLAEVPAEAKKKIKFVPVSNAAEAFKVAIDFQEKK